MTQKERILKHLDDIGHITSLEAFREYGITRLAAVIFKLRKDGHIIDSENVEHINRYGEPVHFTKYVYKYKGVKK